MSARGHWLCVWGHDVHQPTEWSTSYVAPASCETAPQASRSLHAAYLCGPHRIAVALPGLGFQMKSSRLPPTTMRMFALPPGVDATCVSLHPEKPLLAVGTEDHGAFVVPLVRTEKGGLPLGERLDSLEGVPLSHTLFSSVDAAFVSASTGKRVTCIAFSRRADFANQWVVVTGSTRCSVANGEQHFIGVWGLDRDHRMLLWQSPVDSAPLQLGVWLQSRPHAFCLRLQGFIYSVDYRGGTAGATNNATIKKPAASVLEYKLRPMMSIPELHDGEYIAMVALSSSLPSADSGEGQQQVVALTSSGFMVSFAANSGLVLKWMDCKLCPARSLSLVHLGSASSPYLAVGGSNLVRLFHAATWDFGGKFVTSADLAVASPDSPMPRESFDAPQQLRDAVVGVVDVGGDGLWVLSSGGSFGWFDVALPPPLLTATAVSSSVEEKRPKNRIRVTCRLAIRPPPQLCWKTLLQRPPGDDVMFSSMTQSTSQWLLPGATSHPQCQVAALWSPDSQLLTVVDRHSLCPIQSQKLVGATRLLLACPSFSAAPSAVRHRPLVVGVDSNTCGLVVWDMERLGASVVQFPLDGVPAADMWCTPIAAPPESKELPSPSTASPVSYRIFVLTKTSIDASKRIGGSAPRQLQLHRFSLHDNRHALCGATPDAVRLEFDVSRTVVLPPSLRETEAPELHLVMVGRMLLIVDGSMIWDVATLSHHTEGAGASAVPHITLPFAGNVTQPAKTGVLVTDERVIVTMEGSADVLVVDPVSRGAAGEWGRIFAFQAPFPLCGDRGGCAIDSGVTKLAVLDHTRTQMAILLMREKLQVHQKSSIGTRNFRRFAALAFREGFRCRGDVLAVAEEVIPGEGRDAGCDVGGYIGALELLSDSTNSRGARPSQSPPKPQITAAPGARPPLRRASPSPGPTQAPGPTQHAKQPSGRAALPVQHYDPAQSNRSNRSRSCEAHRPLASADAVAMKPTNVTLEGLQQRLSELQQLADVVSRGNGGGAHHHRMTSNNDDGSAAPAPDATGVVFHVDPCRRSGLLMTPQFQVQRSGEVVVRLGQRWGDVPQWGGAVRGLTELPCVRGGYGTQDSTLQLSTMSDAPSPARTPAGAEHEEATTKNPLSDTLATPSPLVRSEAVVHGEAAAELKGTPYQVCLEEDDDDVVLHSGPSTVMSHHPDEGLPPLGGDRATTPTASPSMVPIHRQDGDMPCFSDSPLRKGGEESSVPHFGADPPGSNLVRDDDEDDFVVMDSVDNFAVSPGDGQKVNARVQFGAGLFNSLADPVMLAHSPPRTTLRPSETPQPLKDGAVSTCSMSRRAAKLRAATERVRQSVLDLRTALEEAVDGDEEDDVPRPNEDVHHEDASWLTAELSFVLSDVVRAIHASSSSSRPGSRRPQTSPSALLPSGRVGQSLESHLSTTVDADAKTLMLNSAVQFQALWESMQHLRQQNATIMETLAAHAQKK